MQPNSKVVDDRRLIDLCVAGEVDAWSRLYGEFHDSLIFGIRAFLGRAGQDSSLVDEIAARVWYALVKNDFELLDRFDVQRGCRFSTFLSLIAKNEARLILRSEKRRRKREISVCKLEGSPSAGSEPRAWLSEDEFVETLSPAERVFYFDVLIDGSVSNHSVDYSKQNEWQLRHRVRRKLEQFIERPS